MQDGVERAIYAEIISPAARRRHATAGHNGESTISSERQDVLTPIFVVLGFLLFFSVMLIGVRKDRFRGGGSMGNALQEFHAVFEPGVRHQIEAAQQEQVEEDDRGEPPPEETDLHLEEDPYKRWSE